MIQVRNVPDKLHRELSRRARVRGQTLTAYIQEVLEREVTTLDWEDAVARIRALPPLAPEIKSADLIREGRLEAGRE
jgi:hypothetical protein